MSAPDMFPLAHHTLLECHGCEPGLLEDAAALEPLLAEAVRLGGGTIVTHLFHTFNPYGVTGVIVIAESHVAIHTWPEHAFAAVDIFSCGDSLDHAKIRDHIANGLRAMRVDSRVIPRGMPGQSSPRL